MNRVFSTIAFLFAFLFIFPIHSHAGAIGKDQRLPIAQYAAKHNMTEAQARIRFAASGRIQCPFGDATAFLVYQDDVVGARIINRTGVGEWRAQ